MIWFERFDQATVNCPRLQEIQFESFTEYEPTPLVSLKKMAEYLGISEIFLKDESFRFGLNSFKVLGASFAIGKYLACKFGRDISEMPLAVWKEDVDGQD